MGKRLAGHPGTMAYPIWTEGMAPCRAQEACRLIVMSCVEIGELRQITREILEGVNGIGGADRNASAAIDAIVRVHIELRHIGEASLVLLGVDAVHGAGLDAQLVFGTGIGDDVCHITETVQFGDHWESEENKR